MLSAAGADTSSWSAGSPFMHLVSCNMSCCWGYEWERSNALGEAGLCGQGAFSSWILDHAKALWSRVAWAWWAGVWSSWCGWMWITAFTWKLWGGTVHLPPVLQKCSFVPAGNQVQWIPLPSLVSPLGIYGSMLILTKLQLRMSCLVLLVHLAVMLLCSCCENDWVAQLTVSMMRYKGS